MTKNYVNFSLKNEQPFRLVPARKGKHQFGGRSPHRGIVPSGLTVPLQLVLLLDLQDVECPIIADPQVSMLPLFYPFKYGGGGAEIQYAVRSDSEIEILYLNCEQADEKDQQYLQVDELPTTKLELRALTYEQARILTFSREDGFFQPNAQDLRLLDDLDLSHLISFGGRRQYINNAGDVFCRNKACEWFGLRTRFTFLAAVPPIPVDGTDEFWYEYQGGHVDFCFGCCWRCGTIIAFNVCT